MFKILDSPYQRFMKFLEDYQASKRRLEKESKETETGRLYKIIKDNNEASRYI